MTTRPANSTSRYLHGTAPDEQRRLSDLNTLLNASCLREMALEPGMKVLDVGSGLGQLTRTIARAVLPGGRVLGVERSPEQIAEAIRRARAAGEDTLAEFREGDAADPPLRDDERGSFDLAHARFVLEHVPDPLAVVRAMVRAVRPGGRIVLADDDHDVLRLWPEPPGFHALWRAYSRAFDRLGNDPYVGRRLVQLLYDAGARPRRNTWLFFGGCAGMPCFEPLVLNAIRLFEGARETIVADGLLDAESFAGAVTALRAWADRPDAAMWFSVCWAEGVRP